MKSCCFTGHRSYKLGLKKEGMEFLKAKLNNFIVKLADRGITDFYTGMAEGVDLWAALSVLKLKEEREGIRLIAVIPFCAQADKWKQKDKEIYKYVLDRCDDQYLMNPVYSPCCYHFRNEFMVDKSDCVLAVYNGSPGGTKYTVDYANEKGKKIIVINPNDIAKAIGDR